MQQHQSKAGNDQGTMACNHAESTAVVPLFVDTTYSMPEQDNEECCPYCGNEPSPPPSFEDVERLEFMLGLAPDESYCKPRLKTTHEKTDPIIESHLQALQQQPMFKKWLLLPALLIILMIFAISWCSS